MLLRIFRSDRSAADEVASNGRHCLLNVCIHVDEEEEEEEEEDKDNGCNRIVMLIGGVAKNVRR